MSVGRPSSVGRTGMKNAFFSSSAAGFVNMTLSERGL
jgi:hypothetical protein